jgi:hypothetical protein
MSKAPVGRADEEFIRSAWDWAGEAAVEHRAGIRVSLVPSKRRGVWQIRAQAVEMVETRAVGIRVQVETEWPTTNHSTLAGAVLAALMQLDHQLGIDALQQEPTG